jgi:hypothetical protein
LDLAMKNIQIIDGADNCTFPWFQATDAEFTAIFPAEGQDIEFIEDVRERLGDKAAELMASIWERPVRKSEATGIHGTLFYQHESKRYSFPAAKRERDWGAALNGAQRRLYESGDLK